MDATTEEKPARLNKRKEQAIKKEKDARRAYKELVNRESVHQEGTDLTGVEPTLFGVSRWTSSEKARLLELLESGPTATAAYIAQRIITKSEPEVQAFLRAYSRRKDPWEGGDDDDAELVGPAAAAELDEECIQATDEAAENLQEQELLEDAEAEEKIYDDNWLLDWERIIEIDRGFEGNRLKKGAKQELPPPVEDAFELLSVRELIKFSFRIFMSSEDPEMDWASISDNGPSLFCSALLELHSLVVQLTKRLIASTMFITKARLRATRTSSQRKDNVKPQDVHAALDVIGLAGDRRKYWAKFPRRSGLKIIRNEPKLGQSEDVVSYDEAEMLLNGERTSHVEQSIEGAVAQDQNTQDSAAEDQHDLAHGEDERSEDAETQGLEEKDAKMSMDAVRDMYTLLRVKRPEHPGPIEPSSRSSKKRKVHQDDIVRAGEWKSCVEYHAEWERLDCSSRDSRSPVSDEANSV